MSIYPDCSAWRYLFAYRGLNDFVSDLVTLILNNTAPVNTRI